MPATTGLPIITCGSETIIGSLIVHLLAVTLADSAYPQRTARWGERQGESRAIARRLHPGLERSSHTGFSTIFQYESFLITFPSRNPQ